ncbi:MAG: hypothetical protein F6K17_31990 [Okeania sp. SIO3C4]|nr:hypothetical protein [Okeania sp. SIO3B3]NER06875.1 hypothetical protein [Okeania sp. SIO3C4]
MPEIVTTMLGASGVGKTTLLTSIYEQFSKIQEVNFEFKPDSATEEILQKNLQDLQSMGDEIIATEGTGGIAGTSAIAGPESLPEFAFYLSKTERQLLKLSFRDYPGSYVLKDNPVGREYLKRLLKESAAVIISIDTPAMIEPHKLDPLNSKNWDLLEGRSGRWHDAKNHPEEILDLFKAAYTKLKEPKLVIFAPVKCETYVQTPESAKKLLGCIKDKYSPLLKFLSDPSRSNNISVVTTPIQTVGCLFFSRYFIEDFNKPRFVFKKNSSMDTYNPKDNDHLLRYLLSFLLKRHNDRQIYKRSPILSAVRGVFQQESMFEQAIKQFVKTRKTTDGFTILQGNELLQI